jgi:hypothetical protein
VLAIGLAVIAAIAFFFAPRPGSDAAPVREAPPKPAPSAPMPSVEAKPNELGIKDPAAVDPTELLGRARARAISWHPDAILISLRAEPVGSSGVDLTNGGTIEYWFGRPTGDGLGSGARVSGKRFHIAVTRDAETAAEAAATTARAAIDPNCPFEDVLRKVRASGILPDVPLSVVYEFADKYGKSIFRVTSPTDASVLRAVDGQTCAILVR